MKILKKFWLVLEDSNSTFIGEVGLLEPSCGPTWTSGEELLALVIFRVCKKLKQYRVFDSSPILFRSQLRDDL